MHATALPVLNVELWILRINVDKKKANTSVEADQSAIFCVPYPNVSFGKLANWRLSAVSKSI